jgi:hypothetical protein
VEGTVTSTTLIDLWLTGIEQNQQASIVSISGVIHKGILKTDCGDRRKFGKLARIPCQQGYRSWTVIKQFDVRRDVQITIGYIRRIPAQDKIAITIRALTIQIKGPIRQIIRPAEKNHRQAIERSAANPAVIQFDKLGAVYIDPDLVGVYLVDDDIKC